jgi:hypothetical protein
MKLNEWQKHYLKYLMNLSSDELLLAAKMIPRASNHDYTTPYIVACVYRNTNKEDKSYERSSGFTEV